MSRWGKGESGNPKGRPPKERALTAILEQAGSKTVEVEGKNVSGRRLVACLVWKAATQGKVTFPNGEELVLDPKNWVAVVQWIYSHIDGPAKAQLEVTGKDDGPIEFIEVVRPVAEAEADA